MADIKLMLGNEAIARGLFESGCKVVSSYPGTPSTEITEYAAEYNEIYAEWAPNEKVAMEVAIGAAIGGVRSFCGMKHVGLNVAADPMFTVAYTGINAGMVIGVADDPGMHSSQNEQDSRHYAIAAKLPMLEPSDSAECRDFIATAFEISEQFDTPVLVRLTTRVAHSRSLVTTGVRVEKEPIPYVKNGPKYIMVPANAKNRHVVVEKRLESLRDFAETTPLNRVEKGGKLGIIAAGITYEYAKEALGDKASYLKLGLVHPLPVEMIRSFAKTVDRLVVLEELDDVIETHCLKNGIAVEGKSLFSLMGEYSAGMVSSVFLGTKTEAAAAPLAAPVRPPVLCPGCPHRGIFYLFNKLKLRVSGDIGCYALGAAAPLSAIDTIICMGASVSAVHGMNLAGGKEMAKKTVAVIGDSTFMHSGITSLCNIAYNKGNSTVVILDNRITGMTGHQQNPVTGLTLKNEPTVEASIEGICAALGIRRISVVDPFDLIGCEKVLKEELEADEPSVIIARRPCALLKCVKVEKPVRIVTDACKNCGGCKKIGCPAIRQGEKTVEIDNTLCTGCGLCVKVCRFNAIVQD